MPPLAAKAAEEGGKQPESGGKSRKTADLTLEKDQKDGIQGHQRIVQWSLIVSRGGSILASVEGWLVTWLRPTPVCGMFDPAL